MPRGNRVPGELYVPGLSRRTLQAMAALPITAFVGYNGMGKTMAAVAVAMTHLDAGRPVLSTARLLDYENPRACDDLGCLSAEHGMPGHMAAHPLYIPFTDFRQMFEFKGGHILMDEVTGIADAREHAGMPVQVRNYLPQLRRKDVTLGWTTIHWSFADARLRRMTWAACWAVGLMPKYEDGDVWGRNRLFLHRVYDARNLPDDFEPAKRDEEIKPMIRTFMWGPKTLAFSAYSSGSEVSALGAANDAGMCMTCGGKRAALRCSCVPDSAEGAEEGGGTRRRRRGSPAQRSEQGAPTETGDDHHHDHATAAGGPELAPLLGVLEHDQVG